MQVTLIEKALERLATLQQKHAMLIIAASLVFTAFIATGLLGVRMETDLFKQFPSSLPSIILQDRVDAKFGEAQTMFVLISTDSDQTLEGTARDTRDPRMIRLLADISQSLRGQDKITHVFSASDAFQSGIPQTTDGVSLVVSSLPQVRQFFSRDYSAAIIIFTADIGSSESELTGLMKATQISLNSVDRPAGVRLSIAGEVPLRLDILRLFQSDSLATMFYATIIILALLFVVLRSPFKVFITFFPMLFSLSWTYGTLGLAGIPISFATAALGALILGLGVEYSIFYVKRYEEGRIAGLHPRQSLRNATVGIGSAIIGSGLATIVGFMALTTVDFPMIQQLGLSLSLSIFYSLISCLLVNPAYILKLEERLHGKSFA